MNEGETESWRGPQQLSAKGLWISRALGITIVVSFILWLTGGGTGWMVVSFLLFLPFWAPKVIDSRTRVTADRLGLRVVNPADPSIRRIDWADISHFEHRDPWPTLRPGLLNAVKRDGRRVLVGLPEGHRGLSAWWARHGNARHPDVHGNAG